MEAMEMLLGRRSIRKFKSEQIKDSELEAVLKAGEYAPSGGNQQGGVLYCCAGAGSTEKDCGDERRRDG